ncbi:hypothetical protein LJC52_00390 [Bacteroidales bacterium OttesenSCG-928-A17]|nr:hypothetical protein [Bacteroidales bacterium OttesenSCG-928-A17]
MGKLKPILLLAFCLVLSLPGYAQKGLNINHIFEDIGKQKGTLIQLGPDVLSPQTNIVLYKSLRIKANSDLLETIENALAKDTKSAKILLSSDRKKEGSKTTHYELKKKENVPFYEYILFNYSNGYISLVYLKGNFSSGELKNELNKLKDLFIELK